MRPVHTSASTQSHFWLSASLPGLGVSSTIGSVPCFAIDRTHPPSWLAFAPPALPGFFATMQPLTSVSRYQTLSQISSLNVTRISHHSVSNHPKVPQDAFITLPIRLLSVWVSPTFEFHLFPAGSLLPSGRIEFVILRTGGSPSAASHPTSRRRSCSRIRAGERLPGRDFHPTIQVPSRAHWEAPQVPNPKRI